MYILKKFATYLLAIWESRGLRALHNHRHLSWWNKKNIYVSDRRLSHLPLMDSPMVVIILFFGYIYSTKLGPKLMAARKPFNIKPIIIAYNIVQIVLNTFFSIRVCVILILILISQPKVLRLISLMFNAIDFQLWRYALSDKFSFACQPIVYGDSSDAIFLAYCSYWYFLLKLLDWIDTIFFILRKKNGHLSFLHVYHHSMISVGVYVQALFAPGEKLNAQ